MPMAVLPALLPDLPRIYDIYFASFKNDLMGRVMLDILFPGGTDSKEFREAHLKGTLDWVGKCDFQYTLKCVDTDTGEIVGMGLGDIYLKERTPEERKFEGCTWLEGKQRERAEEILTPLAEMREKLFGGQRYIYIHVIGVDPKHQGRKAGLTFVKWGISLGEACGIPVYFESSPSTVKLYEKVGFVRLKETITHRGKILGMPVVSVEVPLMVHMPSVAGGMTFEEWREAGYPKFGSPPKKNVAEAAISAATAGSVASSTDVLKKPIVTTSLATTSPDGVKVGGRKKWWKRFV